MQIRTNGNKTREDFNEFAYSKGSVYGEYSLDQQSNMLEACRRTANANDYSGAAAELAKLDIARIDKIIRCYPPQLCPPEELELLEVQGDYIRWNIEALLLKLRADRPKFHFLFRMIDYSIVRGVIPESTRYLHHTDKEFEEVLDRELDRFEHLLNNHTG